jgi:hypothetical protein
MDTTAALKQWVSSESRASPLPVSWWGTATRAGGDLGLGCRNDGGDLNTEEGLKEDDYLAALQVVLAGRGLKCDVNDRGAWPRLRIYSPYDIDSAVAEFDNSVLALPRGDDWWFAWPWSEMISPVTDIATAADHIAEELGWASG